MKQFSFSKIFHIYLAIFTALFCFAPNLIALLIVLLGILICVGYVKKQFTLQFYWPHFFLGLLYIAYLIGAFFTDYPKIANGYLENKLSFLIFPLLLSFQPTFRLKLNFPVLGLVAGTFVASFIGLIHSFGCNAEGGSFLSCFTSVNFSTIHHPSYFAIFILIATYGSWFLYFKKEDYFSLKWLIPFTVFSMISFALCFSMAGVIFLFLLIAVIVLRRIYIKWNKFVFYGLILFIPVLLILTLNFTPVLKEDYKYTLKSVENYIKDPSAFVKAKVGYKTGNETRLIMWTVTWDEIKRNPFGVGTGNLDAHLSKRLKEYNQLEYAEMDENHTIKYNPHNQFLQTILEIGWLGGLIFICFLGSSLINAFKSKNGLLGLIVFALIFNSLFESMLQRQSGIVFFSFWICLLVVYLNQKEVKHVEA